MSTDFEELAAAKKLGPLLTTLGLRAEAERRLPNETITALRDAGILASSLPNSLGGRERTPLQLVQLVEELAYADSATAWCTMVYLTTSTQAAFMQPQWAEEIFSNSKGTPLSAGAVAPSGRGRQLANGDIDASGHWAWGSGSHHCEWLVGGTMLADPEASDGGMARLANGEPKVLLLFFHQDEVTLHDNWNPSGLRGTGSVDFDVSEKTVPEGRWTTLGDTQPIIDRPLYHFPYFGLFASLVSAVCLGISRRAIDDFVDLAQGKVPAFASRTISQSSLTQMDFGRAEALHQSASRSLYHLLDETWQSTLAGNEATVEERRQLRIAASQSAQLCASAVDLLYNAGGGSSVRGDCTLQRHFRDIHVATQHRLIGVDNLRLSAAIRLNNKPAGSQL